MYCFWGGGPMFLLMMLGCQGLPCTCGKKPPRQERQGDTHAAGEGPGWRYCAWPRLRRLFAGLNFPSWHPGTLRAVRLNAEAEGKHLSDLLRGSGWRPPQCTWWNLRQRNLAWVTLPPVQLSALAGGGSGVSALAARRSRINSGPHAGLLLARRASSLQPQELRQRFQKSRLEDRRDGLSGQALKGGPETPGFSAARQLISRRGPGHCGPGQALIQEIGLSGGPGVALEREVIFLPEDIV
jgi:hypothetical protein